MPRIHQLTIETMRLDASNGARKLIGALLKDLQQTVPRLDNPSDREALHDFRVAVRRLRSSLRSYRPALQAASTDGIRTRLGEIARATGEARDAEVQLEWITGNTAGCEKHHREGVKMAVEFLRSRMEIGYRNGLQTVRNEIPDAIGELAAAIGASVSPNPELMASFVANAIRHHGKIVTKRIGRITGAFDQLSIHRARIAVKRLRYLIEPAATSFPFARPVIETLEPLQEQLGQLNDLQLISQHITNITTSLDSARNDRLVMLESQPSSAGFQPPSELAGLLYIATAARREHGPLFARVAARWLGDNRTKLKNAVSRLSARIKQEVSETA